MRVLVTGGAGFIGAPVVALLTAAGHDVVAFDVLHPAAHRGPHDAASDVDVPLVRGDVRDPGAVAAALRGVDVVVHQAAMVGMSTDMADVPEYVGCNDLGTAVLLAAMARAGLRRLVLASSMVVYGEGAYACPVHGAVRPAPRAVDDLAAGRFEPTCPRCAAPLRPGLVDEDAPLEPRSVYAATKVAQEHLTAVWAAAVGANAVALRYHNVYGPRMPRDTPYSGVAAIFRSALEHGVAPRVFEDGGQRRDFVHVRDVAIANAAALDATGGQSVGLRAYNIASGQPHTVGELAATLATASGGPPPVVTGEFRAGDVRHVVASPERARRELGFTATVSFEEGVAGLSRAPLRV
ncbi:NAD-dependent epimerase/dehydratase family protein [Dactylosporangium sp. AC04546]|uniref:NAD-dependent epimerase/dehydratase family protein n=1 Tax=Dactylosporangium sp. AC04546 TaxID=2862460 RepID=UPI001EE0CEC1|nr:NAD-dependent epimerase/dehydratase family protein [Dactylosporangium sp. AC04546]WVK86604.1 NAD-dependent epimerase/dehydratase family protein [Dactylosporangium sp. AC04546]